MIISGIAVLVLSEYDFFRRLWAVKFRIIIHDLILAFFSFGINDRYRSVRFVWGTVVIWWVVSSVSLVAELSRYVNFSLVQYDSWARVPRILVSLSVFLTVGKPLEGRRLDTVLLNHSFLRQWKPTFNLVSRLKVWWNLTKISIFAHFVTAYWAIIADATWLLAHSISDAWLPYLSQSIWGIRQAAECILFLEEAEKVALFWILV